MSNLLSIIPGLSKAPTAPSVKTILGAFNTVISQLEDAVSAHTNLAAQHAETARQALASKAESESEIAAAQTAVQNIRALVGTN